MKDHILAEIQRTAAQNGGEPLGRERFLAETGIKESDWLGKYWARWSDAIAEAGLQPNQLNAALPEDQLLRSIADLVKDLGRFPVMSEIKLKARTAPGFPSHNTFGRFGGKAALVEKVRAWCLAQGDEATADLCGPPPGHAVSDGSESAAAIAPGYVYLFRHGTRREFKIGRTRNPLRREGEVDIELPLEVEPLHKIETDDPAGVEAYWHRRFADKRLRGEWFALTPADVRAFRRWRKIF
jgi:hypothetical protein